MLLLKEQKKICMYFSFHLFPVYDCVDRIHFSPLNIPGKVR